MRIHRNQHGSAYLLVFLGTGIILAVALVGYRISQNDTHLAGNAPVSGTVKVPTAFDSTADVKKASNILDATPIDGGVNPNKLDNDLNAVL